MPNDGPIRPALEYATPPPPPRIGEETREACRRTAQRAAGLAIVFFVGGMLAGKYIGRVNGMYGDELFIVLLFLISFGSLIVWFGTFCVWLIATLQARGAHRRTLRA